MKMKSNYELTDSDIQNPNMEAHKLASFISSNQEVFEYFYNFFYQKLLNNILTNGPKQFFEGEKID